jgi:hypothetical protein
MFAEMKKSLKGLNFYSQELRFQNTENDTFTKTQKIYS